MQEIARYSEKITAHCTKIHHIVDNGWRGRTMLLPSMDYVHLARGLFVTWSQPKHYVALVIFSEDERTILR